MKIDETIKNIEILNKKTLDNINFYNGKIQYVNKLINTKKLKQKALLDDVLACSKALNLNPLTKEEVFNVLVGVENTQNFSDPTLNLLVYFSKNYLDIKDFSIDPKDALLFKKYFEEYSKYKKQNQYNPLILSLILTFNLKETGLQSNLKFLTNIVATKMLLKQNGFNVASFISIGSNIFKTMEDYQKTTTINEYIKYMLNIIYICYLKLDKIISLSILEKTSSDKVLYLISHEAEPISKQEISDLLYDYSQDTIEKDLKLLLKENKIGLTSKGRNAKYYRFTKLRKSIIKEDN